MQSPSDHPVTAANAAGPGPGGRDRHGHAHPHDHAHDHGHGHPHGHDHAHGWDPGGEPARGVGRRFVLAAGINAGFVVAETIYGLKAHSLALLADAGHNFGDVLGLLVAWLGWALARRAPSARFSYGWRAASILAALTNGLLLLGAVGAIGWEAIGRLVEPGAGAVEALAVTEVAALGILVNGVTAWLFVAGREDLNVRAAFWHLAADALVSLGVVVSGLVILATGLAWIDPLVSLIIAAVIAWGSFGLLRDCLALALHAAPARIDPGAVRAFLAGQPRVAEVHDLHIWAIGTRDVALSAHLVMPGAHPGDAFLMGLRASLRKDFGIAHTTLQIEIGDDAPGCGACAL